MRKLVLIIVGWLLICPVRICQAQVYPFDVFTSNSSYADDLDGDMYVDVWDGTGVVNFTFYNNSSLQSSVARIYFDDGSLLGVDAIINSSGYTAFDKAALPGSLPGGENLLPPFVADREFTIGAESPPPWEGVNNGNITNEWVTVRFNLINGGDLYDVLDELNSGVLRVGLHVIDLPEGYSESAILVPEPATILLFGLGALALLRKRRP